MGLKVFDDRTDVEITGDVLELKITLTLTVEPYLEKGASFTKTWYFDEATFNPALYTSTLDNFKADLQARAALFVAEVNAVE